MNNLDKEIRSKLYDEINNETTLEEMERIVRKNPMKYFECGYNERLIYAVVHGLNKDNTSEFIKKFAEGIGNYKLLPYLVGFERALEILPKEWINYKLAIKAVQGHATNYIYLDDRFKNTPTVIYETILSDAQMIEHVPQSPDLCMMALIRDYTCYHHINEPTPTMQLFVKTRLEIEEQLKCKVIIEF